MLWSCPGDERHPLNWSSAERKFHPTFSTHIANPDRLTRDGKFVTHSTGRGHRRTVLARKRRDRRIDGQRLNVLARSVLVHAYGKLTRVVDIVVRRGRNRSNGNHGDQDAGAPPGRL